MSGALLEKQSMELTAARNALTETVDVATASQSSSLAREVLDVVRKLRAAS
jgi:hypothetical protein